MKKILFLALSIAITAIAQSQTVRNEKVKDTSSPKPVIKVPVNNVKTTPSTSSSNSNTGTQTNPVYSLTSVRVAIRTGSDNKEFPSTVDLLLANRGNGYIYYMSGTNMRNEMKINSTTEFGLDKHLPIVLPDLTLASIQRQGLSLRIYYNPNFLADAWKIEGVTLTLEFRDQNGALHPTLGNKTIVFNNASGFLDDFNHILLCYTDGQFVPTTSSIQQ
jgi:hypothetical protein